LYAYLNKNVKLYYTDLQPMKEFQRAHKSVLINIHDVITRNFVRTPSAKWTLFPPNSNKLRIRNTGEFPSQNAETCNFKGSRLL